MHLRGVKPASWAVRVALVVAVGWPGGAVGQPAGAGETEYAIIPLAGGDTGHRVRGGGAGQRGPAAAGTGAVRLAARRDGVRHLQEGTQLRPLPGCLSAADHHRPAGQRRAAGAAPVVHAREQPALPRAGQRFGGPGRGRPRAGLLRAHASGPARPWRCRSPATSTRWGACSTPTASSPTARSRTWPATSRATTRACASCSTWTRSTGSTCSRSPSSTTAATRRSRRPRASFTA